MLAFRGIRKTFGGFVALDDVTCEVEGRAIGLLGPNGAGKTTLMKVCLGLLRPDAGEARILGLDARADPGAVRTRLGYAAEGPGRIPGLSGMEMVAFAAELCGLGRRASKLRAHEMLDLVGLDEARHRPVETYSTGMHQRVKLAMALVHDPELVLLDEPTSGLDAGSRDELLDLIVHLRRGGGPAVLLSTHLLHDVERTCDACVIMHRGRVRFSGSLDDLRVRRGRDYELRVRGDIPAFREALRGRGVEVEEGRRPEILFAGLPDGADADLLWAVAHEQSIQLWHLEPRTLSLEEAFMEAIADGPRTLGRAP
jgi:ABC-2 type transport system ATP-binding protein